MESGESVRPTGAIPPRRSPHTPRAMSIHDLPHDALAAKARQAVTNTTADAEMMAAVLGHGYTPEAFDAALADLVAYETLIQEQTDLKGQAERATEDLDASRATFHRDVYMDHAERARRVFRGEGGTLKRLGLNGARARAFDRWAGQVRQLYATALADDALQARLAERGLTAEVLQGALARLDEIVTEDQAQEDLKGRAQQARRDRDGAREPVLAWLSGCYEAAERAFKDHPDWLERIGKVAPSE